jgi:type IV secretory pathway protease TraF
MMKSILALQAAPLCVFSSSLLVFGACVAQLLQQQ